MKTPYPEYLGKVTYSLKYCEFQIIKNNYYFKDLEKLRLMFQFLDGFVHDSKDWTPFEHISYQIPSPLGK